MDALALLAVLGVGATVATTVARLVVVRTPAQAPVDIDTPLAAAGFERQGAGWRRGRLRVPAGTDRLLADVPDGVLLGRQGEYFVSEGLPLFVQQPLQLGWWDDAALRHARTLDQASATIADGRLSLPLPTPNLALVADAAQAFADHLDTAPTLDDLAARAASHTPQGWRAAEALAALDPDCMRPFLQHRSAPFRLLAALGAWHVALDALDDPSVADAQREEAIQRFLDTLDERPEDESVRLTEHAPRLRAEVAIAFGRWDELPPLRALVGHRALVRRLVDGLHGAGRTDEALKTALEVDPWWGAFLLEEPPGPARLDLLRGVADDRYADPQAHAVVARFLERWGGPEDVARLRRLVVDDVEERVRNLKDRLGGEAGAVSLAPGLGGDLSVVDDDLA